MKLFITNLFKINIKILVLKIVAGFANIRNYYGFFEEKLVIRFIGCAYQEIGPPELTFLTTQSLPVLILVSTKPHFLTCKAPFLPSKRSPFFLSAAQLEIRLSELKKPWSGVRLVSRRDVTKYTKLASRF